MFWVTAVAELDTEASKGKHDDSDDHHSHDQCDCQVVEEEECWVATIQAAEEEEEEGGNIGYLLLLCKGGKEYKERDNTKGDYGCSSNCHTSSN